MKLSTKENILAYLIFLAIAFLSGYFFAPKKEKVIKEKEIQVQTVEVEKEKIKYVERTTQKPDGTIIRETEIESNKESAKNELYTESRKEVIEKNKKYSWRVDYLGQYIPNQNNLGHGVSISKRIMDTPFSVGIWGLNGVGVGISIGFDF